MTEQVPPIPTEAWPVDLNTMTSPPGDGIHTSPPTEQEPSLMARLGVTQDEADQHCSCCDGEPPCPDDCSLLPDQSEQAERKPTVRWINCPACKSYRYTWRPAVRQGECQDCDYRTTPARTTP